MTTSTVTPEIVTFAQGVRAALADLPADEVDDLTDGLEADLAEAYAEDLQRELPDPSAYAAELRLAAGLPVRTKVKHGVFAGIGESLRDTRRDIGIAIRGNPALAGIADFLVTLRPMWWVLRAWVACWIVAGMFGWQQGFGFHGGWWLVLAAAIVVSVQWGRGKWRGRGVVPLVAIGNVVAIVALLPVMAVANDTSNWDSDDFNEGFSLAQADAEHEGLSLGGKPVTNVFAYGPDGKLLQSVQLFDQKGRALTPYSNGDEDDYIYDECGDTCKPVASPATLETGAEAFNVFPLSLLARIYDTNIGEQVIDPTAVPTRPEAPFLKVPAVMPPEKKAEPKP